MSLDLWVEASRDLEAEQSTLRMVQAKVAVSGLWPFLALAQSEREFEHRLALAWDHIANQVPVDLLQPVAESLVADFRSHAAKNAEGEEQADDEQSDDGGDMPDWLQTKIKGEGARVEFFHAASGRWVTASFEDVDGGGNPYYFTGGPEGGPATGDTHQFPPHPTGGDPIDPLNQTYPLQPSPWTVTPDTEWKEAPMNLGPNQPGQRMARSRPEHYSDADHYAERGEMDAARHLDQGHFYADEDDRPTPDNVPPMMQGHYHRGYDGFIERNGSPHTGAHTPGEKGSCRECSGRLSWVGNGNGWRHEGKNSHLLDDDHTPVPISKRASEGIAGGTGQDRNPYYFSGGPEGISGPDGDQFPEDVAQGVDPEDRVNELYGQTPISGGMVDNGYHLGSSPHNPAPDSDKLQGTDFDSEQERERWGKAERGEQQASRDSTVGSRRAGFFDPTDPSLRTLAADDPYGSGNPFSMGPDPVKPAGPSSGGMDGGTGDTNTPTPTATPMTTSPRQMPGGGDMGMGGADSSSVSDQAAKQTMGRRVMGESRELQTDDNPTGYGDEYDRNIYERGGPLSTRPRQDPESRGINTPQKPEDPIPTNSSTGPMRQDEEERRQASRVAELLVRELVA